ncbi:C13 family peptidase [Leeia oryzae]|uniref:C13 family peptidase n=1 Tax=Leeia oryzae TaxID=356662 RepID=UPI00036EE8E2|nr:C13 family peptidase [Leeia oryzae]
MSPIHRWSVVPLSLLMLFSASRLFADVPVPPSRAPDALTTDGGKYYGPLSHGRLQGDGLLVFDSGEMFQGQFANGVANGKGHYYRDGRLVYSGDFVNGRWEGHGIYDLEEGGHYEGGFKAGFMDGHGILTVPGSYRYEGEFARQKFQGKGRYVSEKGGVYEGDFANNQFTGQGTFHENADIEYSGSFVNWQLDGPGKITFPGGELTGTFKASRLNGPGKLVNKDGSHFEGNFENNQIQGQGSKTFANGDVYTGEFRFGEINGKGKMVYAKPLADGTRVQEGEWSYGEFVDRKKEARDLLRMETAIYKQQQMLDSTLANIRPSDPARINMYWLGVAGNGTQEVFHREVNFVRRQFESQFATKGRAISLINSRNTLQDQPMATLTSLQQSLNTIARRMDKRKDVLFLFMTSHGSREHVFSLDQPHMDLQGVSARDLSGMLRKTGIRWKVLVISACYSGGFIDQLKDDHTLIMTAARKDRTSFGCADENDFTYFGKAYFKESLNRQTGFVEAFHHATQLISQWETKDQKTADPAQDGQEAAADAPMLASEPQLYEGKAIGAYLKKWRAQLP